ncbi:DUF2975 domain-containing protein [Novosphingobium bradum]|uniref:DUF2975 domain-containing protein n=1 Tax=Novosphingobium bradum TaxID=1737444 RepID=A0ABV7ILI8_9SPHN
MARRYDPLLSAARTLVTMLLGMCGLGAIAAAAGAPLILAWKPQVLDYLAHQAGHPLDPRVAGGVALLLLLGAVVLALSVYFLVLLRGIIDSVARGETFAAPNAARLARMGWLAAIVEAVSIPAGAVAFPINRAIGHDRLEFGLSPGVILLALVLFILARVFREGAKMREELEGTV